MYVLWYSVRYGSYAKFDELQWQIIADEFVDNIIGFVKEKTTNWHRNIYMRRFVSHATDAQLLSQTKSNQKLISFGTHFNGIAVCVRTLQFEFVRRISTLNKLSTV